MHTRTIQINTEDILCLLLYLKPNKASGPDKIPNQKNWLMKVAPVLLLKNRVI